MFNRVIPRSRDEFHSLSVEDKARNESFGVEGKNSSRTVSEFKKCKFDFSRDNEEVVNRKPIFCPPPLHATFLHLLLSPLPGIICDVAGS